MQVVCRPVHTHLLHIQRLPTDSQRPHQRAVHHSVRRAATPIMRSQGEKRPRLMQPPPPRRRLGRLPSGSQPRARAVRQQGGRLEGGALAVEGRWQEGVGRYLRRRLDAVLPALLLLRGQAGLPRLHLGLGVCAHLRELGGVALRLLVFGGVHREPRVRIVGPAFPDGDVLNLTAAKRIALRTGTCES